MVGAEETVCTRAVFGLSPTEGYEEFDKMTVHTTNCFAAGCPERTAAAARRRRSPGSNPGRSGAAAPGSPGQPAGPG